MAKESSHHVFNVPLIKEKPITISMPPNLISVELEIQFPDGLYEEVWRDSRHGQTHLRQVQTMVAIDVLERRGFDLWDLKSWTEIKENKSHPFSRFIVLDFNHGAFLPAEHIRICRRTEPSNRSMLQNATVLRSMNVEYIPRKIRKAVTQANT